MKPAGALAILLSIAMPGGAFAQNYSAARAGAAAESGVTGAIGTVQVVPSGLGALTASPLISPLIAPGLTPVAGLAPATLTPVMSVVSPVAAIPAALASVTPAAAVEAHKVSAVIPTALAPVQPAAAKDGKAADQTWTVKLAAMFDGGAAKKGDELEPESLKAFVVRHGQPMREITMSEAKAHGGLVRLLTAKSDPTGLNEKHAAAIGAQNETITIDWARQNAATNEAHAAAAAARPFTLGDKLLWPVRELKFLGKSFRASLVKPLPSEVLGGIATKSFPLITSIGVYWAAVGLAHPLALGGLILLSLSQEIFHGIFLKSWNNFQEVINRERGFNYQMFFNLAYMQGFGTLYRLLSWSANPQSVTPPWSVHYWKDMAVMSVVGTFFGVMGYNSLNQLYNKGAIKRWQHSGIQQMRDLLFLLAGPFFASGSMTVFWSIFLFQQSLDLAIAIWAGRTQPKEIVFVTSAAIASSLEFQKKYPLAGVAIESPAKQAVKAVWENPLVRIATWPARALWKLVRGGAKK